MELSPTAKVGMLAVVALIFAGIVFSQIGHMGTAQGTPYTIVFSDVMGLQMRAAVQFAGVNVGYVSDIKLNDQNMVEVTIMVTREDVQLYGSEYFTYTITSDVLGSKWLDIRPGPVPEGAKPVTSLDRLSGTSPVSFDTLARQGSQMMQDIEESINALNDIIDDPAFKGDIKQSVTNFRDITGNLKDASVDARDIVRDLQLRVDTLADALQNVVGHVDETVLTFQSDAKAMGQDLRHVTGTVNEIVQTNAGNVNDIVANLRAISVSLRNTAETVEKLAEDEDLQGDVKQVADNLRKVSEEVAGILGDVRSITKDPQVQEDIKETVHNVRETSDSAKRIVNKAEGVVDRFTGKDGKGGILGKKLFQADISHDWDLRNGNPNANINAMLFPEGPFTAVLGVDSIGNRNLLNLQGGYTWEKARVRGGVIRSKFGIGADAFLFDKRFEASLDVYDTKDVKVDIMGKVLLPKDFFIYGGVRDVTDHRHSSPVVGAGKRF